VTPDEEVLGQVVAILEGLAIPYMVTGSVAASYHGRPRATHDADVVIDPAPEQMERLVGELERSGFYVPADAAREALRTRRPFNVIEATRATKIDLIVRKERPFSVEELRRRQRVDLPIGRSVAIVSAEDSILSKLEWARLGGDSARQIRDAAGVVELNPNLDRRYVEHWAAHLGVLDLWEQIASGSA
jgi:hypothetical protein